MERDREAGSERDRARVAHRGDQPEPIGTDGLAVEVDDRVGRVELATLAGQLQVQSVVVEPRDEPVRGFAGGDAAVLVDVGDVVRVLVPDAAGVHPVVARIAVDLDPGRGAVAARRVRCDDDLGIAVAVHVGDDRVLVGGAGAGRHPRQLAAGGAVVHPEIGLILVDDLGLAVALEVEDRRAGRARAGVEGVARPLDGAVGLEDRVLGEPGDADLGLAVAIEVGDGGRAAAAPAGERHRPPFDGAVRPQQPHRSRRDHDHVRPSVAVEIADRIEAVRARRPVDRAVRTVRGVARDDLRFAVAVEVGHQRERAGAVVALAGGSRPAERAIRRQDGRADHDLGRPVAVEVGDRGAAPARVEAGVLALHRAVVAEDDDAGRILVRHDLDDAVAVEIAGGERRLGTDAVARVRHVEDGPAARAADRTEDAVRLVDLAGVGAEHDVGRVVPVDPAVGIVVGQLDDERQRDHVGVRREDGARPPCPFEADRQLIARRRDHLADAVAGRIRGAVGVGAVDATVAVVVDAVGAELCRQGALQRWGAAGEAEDEREGDSERHGAAGGHVAPSGITEAPPAGQY